MKKFQTIEKIINAGVVAVDIIKELAEEYKNEDAVIVQML